MSSTGDPRREIPLLDHLLSTEAAAKSVDRWGRTAVAEALRAVVDELREELSSGAGIPRPIGASEILNSAETYLAGLHRPGLRPVLNGTGVVLHTNLGRAPLPAVALEHMTSVGRGYCSLELDVERGERSERHKHCAAWIRRLTGSEDALVVNNTAAAIALTVNRLARRKQVIVARGELVEIGGSFRLPDVVQAAGGELVEVGTTNRTRPEDYRSAAGPQAALLLKVHPSNYRIEGFTEQTALSDLVRVGQEIGIPVAHDLGSGLLMPELVPLLPTEPTPAESVSAGADLVMWSGDKLLGGPQAGIIHGRKELIAELRGSPLLRAFRVDKLTLAALETTLALYANPARAALEIPVVSRLSESAESVRARAVRLRDGLEPAVQDRIQVVDLASLVGGGTFPGAELPLAGWRIEVSARAVDRLCRAAEPPLVGRMEDDAFLIDFRTLNPGTDDEDVARLIGRILSTGDVSADGRP